LYFITSHRFMIIYWKRKCLYLSVKTGFDLKFHGIVLSNCYELKTDTLMCLTLLLILFFIWKLKAWWRWGSKFLKNPYICDLCKCVFQIYSFFTLSVKIWLCVIILIPLLLICNYSALVFIGLLARVLSSHTTSALIQVLLTVWKASGK
jgi:hypothetical protein